MNTACAVLLAAGSARRMNADQNKVLMKFDDQSAVIRCLKTFAGTGLFSSFVIVCREDEIEVIERKVADHVPGVRCSFCVGGSERQYSVEQALEYVPEDAELIAVHDAARCFVTPEIVTECMRCAEVNGSAVTATRATDTIKRVTGDVVEETLQRDSLVCVQTPQIFAADTLREAYRKAREDGFLGTDDASLVERLGVPVHISTGSPENIKLTVQRDIEAGERILQRRREEATTHVGFGFDMHRFSEKRPLVLGGVHIPHSCGLEGHSDADVLAHAITDAILGAACLPDIGQLFPDTDPAYENISSLRLLADAASRARSEGFSISNIDSTLLLESPKIAPYKAQMISNIADAAGVLPSCVNVKATTLEKLGTLGRGEGAGAQAVCLLKRSAAHA